MGSWAFLSTGNWAPIIILFAFFSYFRYARASTLYTFYNLVLTTNLWSSDHDFSQFYRQDSRSWDLEMLSKLPLFTEEICKEFNYISLWTISVQLIEWFLLTIDFIPPKLNIVKMDILSITLIYACYVYYLSATSLRQAEIRKQEERRQ